MPLRVGLIGCGNISDIYLLNAGLFRDFDFVACADLREEAAKKQAQKYNLQRRSIEALLASDDVDIVLNLTIPEAHAEVSRAAIAAGKHVYGEKPLATRLADGIALMEAAKAKGLRVGCAPDTVLGAAIQQARLRIDAGEIGRPLIGTAAVLGHGMEHWHPNPEFFFKPGAGPVFDMGPYYLSTLVNLLGPVASVMALSQSGFEERVVTTEGSPFKGQSIRVETPTSIQALLAFKSGAQITFLASWDVWAHGQQPIELHGTDASLRVPDPNWFGGEVSLARPREAWESHASSGDRFGQPNWPADHPVNANYRGLGLADMARGIVDGRPHRASGEIGLHVLAVMEGILTAAEQKRPVLIEQGCERPAPLGDEEARGLLA
ncbi:Gfo/Idh/MocA family oxidoreductase [Labrys sp. LIt4]|uniref:Gfo/Idh/MocA family protein n=1 Tax=Labrys sp. LIt4 TaxID=2821355 RepID=UPI001AE0424E|nr:Gfo/Idh/MocA family oxidoreductase [Labrys sp. LIt4]MBP0577721.1 Gfo/Idh/MocA family oxidoreductase [Labrys sp. LIt4]